MINQSRLTKTFMDLVRIDSPSGEEEGIAQELTRRLTTLGFDVRRDGHGNVIASEDGDNPLLLSAHMDTVEPGRGIKPRVQGDRIVSDGTTILGGDCKAGISAILEALQSIKESETKRRPAQVVFTRGEEIGLVGAKNLDASLLKAKEGVIFDGNGPPSKVTIASPTNLSFDVTIKGRAAHAGAEPEKGLSAIRIATDIISMLPQGRLDAETTFNIGVIKGGSVRNAVPENCAFSGEFRSRNQKMFESLKADLLEILDTARKNHPEAVITATMDVGFEAYNLKKNDPMVQRVSKVLRTLGMTPELGPSGGGTDGNVFSTWGVKCVVVGMSTQEMHTTREFVPVADLVKTATFCQALLTASP